MNLHEQKKKGPSRRGGAAVEFALILPLLTILVLGCIDFGRFAYTYIALTNAAESGALFGSNNPYTAATYATWQAQVQAAVAGELSAQDGFSANQLSVTASAAVEAGGLWCVNVDARYPFQTIVSWPGLPNSLILRRVAVMRGVR
jgi:Flp pilus assembly protein TadG